MTPTELAFFENFSDRLERVEKRLDAMIKCQAMLTDTVADWTDGHRELTTNIMDTLETVLGFRRPGSRSRGPQRPREERHLHAVHKK